MFFEMSDGLSQRLRVIGGFNRIDICPNHLTLTTLILCFECKIFMIKAC